MSRDFASLLDELLKTLPPAEDDAQTAGVSIAVTPPLDPLDAFWSSISSDVAAMLYAETGAAQYAAAKPELPSVQPDRIAAELGLDRLPLPRNLDRLRRAFAFANHPDRVPAEQRERAMIRMQVANQLIDEAKRAGAAKR